MKNNPGLAIGRDYFHNKYDEKEGSKALNLLKENERLVLVERYFNDNTLAAIGKKMSLSPERIRQIECRALRKLRHPSRNKYLNGFCL